MNIHRFVAPIRIEIFTHLRRPLRLLGIALLAPTLVGAVFREWTAVLTFGAIALACYGSGWVRDDTVAKEPSLRDSVVTTALSYLLWSLVGGLAFWIAASTSFIDGFFEAMSGFTTTGLSVMRVEELPKSLVFFRAYSQWIGGAGIVILTVIVLPGPRNLAFRLSRAERNDENLRGSVVATARVLMIVYGTLTLVGFLAYLVSGMGAFDAACHALSTLSTGGFSSYDENLGRFPLRFVPITATFLMLAGATAFPLYYRSWKRSWTEFFADPQFRVLLFVFLGASALGILAAGRDQSYVTSVFHVTSALTTTGFNVTGVPEWSPAFRLLCIALMIVGGSLGSTSGGIKLFRVIVMWQVARWWLLKAQLPSEATLSIRYGGRETEPDDSRRVLAFFFLYLLMLGGSTVLISFAGFPAYDALFESASALGTVGLSTGITSAELPSWVKLVLAVDMWAGRLEMLPVLILLYPRTWWARRSAS